MGEEGKEGEMRGRGRKGKGRAAKESSNRVVVILRPGQGYALGYSYNTSKRVKRHWQNRPGPTG